MALSTLQIINIAKVSQYLAQNDVAKGNLFGPRKIPITPQVLYAERKAVEWMYNLDPSNSTLALTGNYLYSLCRGYNLRAQNIINAGGGGSISPINPSTAPSSYDFIVNTTTSFILAGATTKQFPANWVGWNILFVRNHVTQSLIDDGNGSTYYSWDKTTATLSLFNGAATDTEPMQIFPIP